MAKQESLRQQTLIQVVIETRDPSWFFTDMHFWNVKNFLSRQVQIDIVRELQEVANFRSPMSDPNVLERTPFERQTHTAPYIHESVALSPDDLTYVRPGEDPYSETALAARMVDQMAEDAIYLKGRVKRKIELMASILLNGGKITISGDGFPSYTLDFKMPSGNKFVLTGSDQWSNAASTPLEDMRLAIRTIAQESGLRPNVMHIGSRSYDLMLAHADVKEYLDKRHATFIAIDPKFLPRGVAHVGEFDSVQMFTYDETYLEGGVAKLYMPENRIFFGSTDAQCIRAHGAILNFKALRAMEYFVSESMDPRGKKLYRDIESAPLLGLSQSSAFGYMEVEAAA